MSKFPPYKKAKTAELTPYQNNARTHSDSQINQIANSIVEFGFINPIVVDGNNGIIAGHGRWLAAKQLGLDTLPVVDVGHLTPQQRRAYVLADNQLALNAGWDEELLKVELDALMADDFDVSVIGFNDNQLADILEDDESLAIGLTDEDELPGIAKKPTTAPGDVWLLGKHRLMCGEPVSVDAWDCLIVDGGADAFFLATPEKIKSGALAEMIQGIMGCIVAKAKEDAAGYVAFHWSLYSQMEQALTDSGATVNSCIVWDRGRPARCSQDYRPQHDCLFYVNGGRWYGQRRESDLWLLDCADIDYNKNKNQKPVALYERALKNSTKRGDVVLAAVDEYGSALIACEKNKRRLYAIETTPLNCDRIIERWQNYTGKAAVLESDGEPFDSKKE